jgi:ATP-dependent RNA helicase TDRD9
VGATSLAKRVSEELGERCGQTVGYIIGGHRCVSKETKLVYCTSGYLLQKLVYHPLQIRQYTHLILDEVHERTADADFVMLLVRKLVMELSPLTKIILMSATLQGKLFVNYFREMFDKEKVPDPIFVGLKRFEVKEYFLDQIKDVLDDSTQSNHQLAAKSYLESLCGLKVFSQLIESFNPSVKPSITLTSQEVCSELIIHYSVLGQSILVFLPGLSDIMDYYDILSDVLKRRKIDHLYKLFVLHSQVPIEEQHLILKSPPLDVVHVILSTNIAETALTIPQLAVIINFGICRLPKYDHKRQMMQLVTSWCSKSSCSQRAGRVGRLFEGTAIHLFPKSFHQHVLPDFNPPEMHTTPLGKLLLRARQIGEELNISSPSELLKLVVEPPSLLQLEHALQELLFIGAIVTTDCTKVTEDSDITLLGKFSLALSIDLELCRLVFYSLCFGCPVEGIIMAAAISHHQDVFTMPSRVLINSTESYLQSLKNSLRTRFEYDDGIYSDLIVICRLYQSLLQFCIDNSLKFTKGLNKFCTFQSTSYQRLHSLVCIISSLADSVLNFVDKSNSSYNKIYLLTQVTTSSDMGEFHDTELFCNDEGIMQSVIMAAFIRNVVFGKRKIESDIAGERKKACIGRDVIDRFKFKPGKSLVSNCNRKLTTNDLEKIVKYVCPDSSCKVIIDGFMCAVEVTDLYCEGFDVPLLWQFGERRGSKMDDGTPYPYFFSPYELVWNRIHGNHERLNLFSWRNKTGFVCELSEAPPARMGVVSVIQGSESTEFVRGKYLTLFPSLTTSRLSVLLLLAFQPFHVPVQLRNNGKCITAMKIDQFEIDFEKWQVLTVEDVMIINKLRRALSKVVGCTDKHSCLPWGQLVDIQKFLSLMIDESGAASDRKHSINDESSGGGGLFESEVISCELYPRYTSSLLTMNEIQHNGEDKERKISSGKHVRFSTTTTTTPLDGPAPSVVPVTPPAVPPLAPSVVPVTPPAVPPLAPSVVPVTPPAVPPLAPSVVPVTPPAIPPLAPSAVSPWLSQQTTTTHQLSVYQLPLLRNPPVSMSPPQVTNHPPISNHPRVTLLGYPPGFRPSSPLTTPPRPFVPHLPSSCVPLNGGTIVPSPIGPIELTIIKTLMTRNYTMPFKELMNNKCIVQCFVQYKVPLNLDFFRMRSHLFDVDDNFNVTIK